MSKKTLIETNPYLKDPKKRRELIHSAVSSSTAIETGYIVQTYTVPSSGKSTKTSRSKKSAKSS